MKLLVVVGALDLNGLSESLREPFTRLCLLTHFAFIFCFPILFVYYQCIEYLS